MPQMMFVLGQVSQVQKKFVRGKKDSEQESLNNFCYILWEQFVLFHCGHEKKKKKENPYKMSLAIGD